jgi:hypothetical protein
MGNPIRRAATGLQHAFETAVKSFHKAVGL